MPSTSASNPGRPQGELVGTLETVAHDSRLLGPDTMSIATDGHRYVTAHQLDRQVKYREGGEDERRWPCSVFRLAIDAGPVLLRR